jgi:type III pantothenate kinase
MTRYLLIDSGNTRIKLAVATVKEPGPDVDDVAWTDLPSLTQLEVSQAPGRLDAVLGSLLPYAPGAEPIAAVAGANVAGHAAQAALERALGRLRLPAVRWIAASAQAWGVASRYQDPARLGADRWASLLGAHRRYPGQDLILATFGTATTIDALDRDGVFLGGVILPGLDLMRAALAGGTAQLPWAEGHASALPINTEEGIMSGCIAAQIGAVAVQCRHFRNETGREPRLAVAGGSLPALAAWLPPEAEPAPRLVFEGLLLTLAAPMQETRGEIA